MSAYYESGGGEYFDDFWGGGGGYDYWSNFDPVTGYYLPTYGNTEGDYSPSGYSGDDWWKNLIGAGGDTLYVGRESMPFASAPLPSGPSNNWWDFLAPFLPSISSTGPTTDYDDVYGLPYQCPPGFCPDPTSPTGCSGAACSGPDSGSRTPQQQRRQTSSTQNAPQQRSQSPQRQPPPCPQGQVRNPNTGQCVAIPKCPQGTQFNPNSGRCEKLPAQNSGANSAGSCNWLCWLLIIGAGVVVTKAVTDDSTPKRRRK